MDHERAFGALGACHAECLAQRVMGLVAVEAVQSGYSRKLAAERQHAQGGGHH